MKNKFLTAIFFSMFLLFSINVKAANFIDNRSLGFQKNKGG
jgi:hypothetical protein